MEKIAITEKQGIHKEWYTEAKTQTLDTLPEFMNRLANNYSHDYGTICHAISASAIGAAWAIEHSESGGITGFQAGCIMWGFITYWNRESNKLGMKLLDYDNILYPQYEDHFINSITPDTWNKIQEEAKLKLSESDSVHPDVKKHWESIVAGNIPFNFIINEND